MDDLKIIAKLLAFCVLVMVTAAFVDIVIWNMLGFCQFHSR